MKIKCLNPYFDEKYETNDLDAEDWKLFLDNFRRGNEKFITFNDVNKNCVVTINPSNFAAIEVRD